MVVCVCVCVCVCWLGALSNCSVYMTPSALANSSYVYGFTVDGPYAWVSANDKGLVRCAYNSAGAAHVEPACSAAPRLAPHALARSDSEPAADLGEREIADRR